LFDRARDPVRARISEAETGKRTDLTGSETEQVHKAVLWQARLIVNEAPDLVEQDQ